MTTTTLTVTLGNIRQNPPMPQADVTDDADRLAAVTNGLGGLWVAVVTECRRRRYKAALRAAFRQFTAVRGETQVITNAPIRRTRRQRLHDGVAKVTPARFNVVRLLDTDVPVAVIGKHTVSGAFRKGANRARTTRVGLRARLWRLDQHLTRRKAARLVAHGWSVVIAGDLNTLDEPDYHPAQQVAAHRGLMWVLVIPAEGVDVHLLEAVYVAERHLHTDHPFIGRRLGFRRRTIGTPGA